MTRLLPTLVVLVLPFLPGYVVVYRIIFYPRYLEEYRRIDTRKTYKPVAKKSDRKQASSQTFRRVKVGLLPGKALIGLALAPVVYYVVMAFIAIPPDVPPTNHDHILHQFGLPVLGLLGYLIGLAISLGGDARTSLSWLKPQRR